MSNVEKKNVSYFNNGEVSRSGKPWQVELEPAHFFAIHFHFPNMCKFAVLKNQVFSKYCQLHMLLLLLWLSYQIKLTLE